MIREDAIKYRNSRWRSPLKRWEGETAEVRSCQDIPAIIVSFQCFMNITLSANPQESAINPIQLAFSRLCNSAAQCAKKARSNTIFYQVFSILWRTASNIQIISLLVFLTICTWWIPRKCDRFLSPLHYSFMSNRLCWNKAEWCCKKQKGIAFQWFSNPFSRLRSWTIRHNMFIPGV